MDGILDFLSEETLIAMLTDYSQVGGVPADIITTVVGALVDLVGLDDAMKMILENGNLNYMAAIAVLNA